MVSLRQTDPTFRITHEIQRYSVGVLPEPSPTCSSDSASLDSSYDCTGFEIGRRYSYSVNGVNCGDQEGERSTFSLHPQGKATQNTPMLFWGIHVVMLLNQLHQGTLRKT